MSTLNQLLSDPNFIKLDAELCRYNIFKALRIDHYEVRHSKFLAHLLDPNETHGLEAEFLQNFLLWLSKFVVGDIPVNQLDLDMASISTEKELSNGKPRYKLDVLIEIPRKQDPKSIYRIAIECKIRAGVGSNQLSNYSKGLEGIYPNDKGGVAHKVLLTISQEWDENVLGTWVNVTYQDTVMKAIATTLLKIEKTSSSRIIDILNDYNDLLVEQTVINEVGSERLNKLCSDLKAYKDVIRGETNDKSNYDYLVTKFRNAITYLEEFFKRDSDLQSKMLRQFNQMVKDREYCSGYSNRQYLRFYPDTKYPFVLTDLENSFQVLRQEGGDAFAYPLLFQVIMEQMKNAAGFRARCVLELYPLLNNSIDNRQQVREAIRRVLSERHKKSKSKVFKVVERQISGTFTRIASTGWETISSEDQIERFLKALFDETSELAKAIQESKQWKNTALDPSPAESSSASEEACKTTSTPE